MSSRPKVVAIRHVPFEDLGAFAPELVKRNFDVQYLDAGIDALRSPATDDAELLVVLGGPIGANQEDIYPFLTTELQTIESRIAANRPLIGICLGAQLMARSLGARVYPGPAKEIGFAPIELTSAGQESCLCEYEGSVVLHWHGDTFDLPENSKQLASSAICENQAFIYGSSAIAFQFHPEAAGNQFETWLIAHNVELTDADIDIRALREEWKAQKEQLQARAQRCLARWLDSQAF